MGGLLLAYHGLPTLHILNLQQELMGFNGKYNKDTMRLI